MKRENKTASRGQSFAELSIIMAVLLVLCFGVIEFARMISLSGRMAAVTREVGRMVNAQEYDPSQMVDVFNVATNMIAPADLENHGRVIISFVQRVPGSMSNVFVTPPTDTNRDYLIITDRFYYPYQAGDTRVPATNNAVLVWPTHLPAVFDNGTFDVATRRYVAFSNNVGPVVLDMLSPSGKTAVVEVFHTNQLNAPLSGLGISMPTYLYDASAF